MAGPVIRLLFLFLKSSPVDKASIHERGICLHERGIRLVLAKCALLYEGHLWFAFDDFFCTRH